MSGGDPGRIDPGWLLASDEGRLPRAPYWYFVLTVCASAAVLVLIPAFRTTPLAIALFQLALLYPCYCVFAKRMQDLGLSGKWAMAMVLVAAGDVLFSTPTLYQASLRHGLIGHLWWWLSLGNALCLIVLGLLPGTPGSNRYGFAP